MTTTDDLSPDVADRLRRLADAQTAASLPWPGVDIAIRRSRRRRAALTAAALSVLLAAGAGTTSLILHPDTRAGGDRAASQSTNNHLSKEFRAAGITTGVFGPLAGDATLVAGLRTRAFALAKTVDEGPPETADHVFVFWAGDRAGHRLAVVGWQPARNSRLIIRILYGNAGDAPGDLQFYRLSGSAFIAGDPLASTTSTIVLDQGDRSGSILVFAPLAASVELAAERHFDTGGTTNEVWVNLQRQGSVWVGTADRTAAMVNTIRIDGTTDPAGGSSLTSESLTATLRGVAAPGTDLAALDQARQGLEKLQVTSAERPVLVETGSDGSPSVTAAVLRSPDQAYLGAFTVQSPESASRPRATYTAAGVFNGVFGTFDDVMTAFEIAHYQDSGKHVIGYVVVAPEGATQVRSDDASAVVRGRLAFLPAPTGADQYQTSAITVEAVDAAGRVIGTVQAQLPPYNEES